MVPKNNNTFILFVFCAARLIPIFVFKKLAPFYKPVRALISLYMKILVYKFIIIIIFVIFTRIDSFSDQAYLNDFVLSYQNYSKYILLNSTTSIFNHL